MRHLLFLFVLFPALSLAQPLELESKISSVIVYPGLAQITRTGEINLPIGTSELLIPHLSKRVVSRTIQLGLEGNGINIQEVGYLKNFLEVSQMNAEKEALQDSLQTLIEEEEWLKNEKEILAGEEAILKANQRVYSNNAGVSTTALEELLDYYRQKVTSVRRSQISVDQKIKRIAKRKKAFSQQIRNLSADFKENGEIRVKVQSRSAQKAKLKLAYIVNGAGWTPHYDIRAADFNAPLAVTLKAGIYQSTGQDWEKVKLQLSNAEPMLNNNHPEMQPLFVRQITASVDTVVTFDPVTYEAPVQIVRNEANPEEWSDSEQNLTSSLITLSAAETVPSTGKEQVVTIWDKKIPAQLQYYSLPRESPYVYLLAEITQYGQYQLEAGQANIFNQDVFIGTAYLNPDSASDTLQLSLGIDQDISVERVGRDFSEKKWLGSNRKETYEYDLCIRNNKAVAVEVRLLDQIPISTNKNIEIELLKREGANYNKRSGGLTWLIDCKPNQAEHRKFSYSVKYPKEMLLEGRW